MSNAPEKLSHLDLRVILRHQALNFTKGMRRNDETALKKDLLTCREIFSPYS